MSGAPRSRSRLVVGAGRVGGGWAAEYDRLFTDVAVALNGFRRRGSPDSIGLLVIATTLLSLMLAWLSGSAFFALVRASFVTFGIGILFLFSLALERPALFFLARDTVTGTKAEAAAFARNWQSPQFRQAMRRLTLVWAGFLIGEALLRVAIAAIWPIPALGAATQLVGVAAPVLLVGWSVRAGRRWSGTPGSVAPAA